MNKSASLQFNDNIVTVTGDLHFSNVTALFQESAMYFAASNKLIFDFSNVSSSDSTGLVLILEWLKLAKRNSIMIKFQNLPHHLISIATAASLDSLILA